LAVVAREQMNSLIAAIHSHDFLCRMLESMEQHHRLVFHANENADWNLVRATAEQILVAEIVSRHKGNIDGVYFALRDLEAGGRTWAAAISELAGRIHSYFTTPLGVVMRKNLFGDNAVFLTTDAYDWIARQESAPARSEVPNEHG
jgi:hypothetical protein